MVAAKVVEVIGIEGSEEGKILVRNARGPIREDDVVHIKETEMEG
ncbi:MAG: hypothetical protein BRC27_02720 [Nanohaloarchaea archaeon SW_10_44_10]|nr:MAG: hypothetical protein BRC27_02720 [Nanohaloarchaea archaeon SW_10_44_10]